MENWSEKFMASVDARWFVKVYSILDLTKNINEDFINLCEDTLPERLSSYQLNFQILVSSIAQHRSK